jgi:hypothetical protein
MPTTAEHIAVEALREIVKGSERLPLTIARTALDQIDALNKPAVHHLAASDVIIDKPPGGGFDF